jgi:prepilin-type N-terminal cleavage/methylation domain-containing protein
MSLRYALSPSVPRRARRQGLLIGQASERGFTLIELSVVILIIAVFAGFTVREARLGAAAVTDPNCADLPVSSCLNTPWAGTPAASRLVDGHAEASGGEMSDVTLGVVDSSNSNVAALEICFTPSGRSFAREAINDGVAFTPLTQAYLATVSRGTKSRQRDVVLMPNGTARLSAQ